LSTRRVSDESSFFICGTRLVVLSHSLVCQNGHLIYQDRLGTNIVLGKVGLTCSIGRTLLFMKPSQAPKNLFPVGPAEITPPFFSIDVSCVGPEPVLANIRVLRIKWHRKEERFRTSGGGAPVVGRNRRSQTVGVVGRIQKILDERQRCAVDELGPDGDDRRVVFRDFRLQKTPFFSIFPMFVPSLSW
jgi:hypothetical protein